MKYMTLLLAGFLLSCVSALAVEPDLKTPSPVIYLADNLDENQNLGWCIDTVGRGYNDKLHAHSCKPQGGDVQFTFLEDTGQIQSVAFPDKCVTVIDQSNAQIPLGLEDCDIGEQAQQFVVTSDAGLIKLNLDDAICVGVGAQSRSAGPFMSRDLIIENCENLSPERKQWMVRN